MFVHHHQIRNLYTEPENRPLLLQIILLTAAIISCIPTVSAETNYPLDNYTFVEIFPPVNRIQLAHQFLIPDSETVMINDLTLKRTHDYNISYLDGIIEITGPYSDSIRVKYQIFPYKLRRYYYHQVLPEAEKRPPEAENPEFNYPPVAAESGWFNLQRSGSIFRSISFGSDRDPQLNSGLELQLNGKLSRETSVNAALSDQNIPLQPKGETRTLEEIDKVFINIQSENYAVNLGDYNLNVQGGQFCYLDRKLTGAQGVVEGDNYQTMFSAASSNGEYQSMSFSGSEGLQGPYQLTGKKGETGIIVLAGTEKVWVDGIAKIRGENYDYIMDYSRGEITFTERQPIHSESRIVIDFQYSAQEYPRNLYHSRGEIGLLDEKLKFNFLLGYEADERDNPVSFPLSNEAKSALKAGGDNPTGAVISSAQYMGMNKGDYIRSQTPDSIQYYVWVGRDSGDYDVSFSYLGANLGSYSREYSAGGDIYYVWEGAGLGDYDAVTLLPPPQSQQLADINLNYALSEKVKITMEGAGTRQDLNTFSPLDDGDNNGYAYSGEVKADSINLSSLFNQEQKFGLSFKTRNLSSGFVPLDRTNEAEYNRRWGYTDTLTLQEESYEVNSWLAPYPYWKLGFNRGELDKSQFYSSRSEVNVEFSPPGSTHFFAKGEDIRTIMSQSDGYWKRGRLNFWRKIWQLQPGLDFEGEDRKEGAEGFRFSQWRPSLKINGSSEFLSEFTYRRDEIRLSDNLEPCSKLYCGHLSLAGEMGSARYLTDFTHSLKTFEQPDSADVSSSLGRFEYDNRMLSGAMNISFKHTITQTRTAQSVLIPFEVGWGEGEYVQVGDQYYPDPNGNYLLITQSTGEFTPSAKVKSSVLFQLDFRKLPSREQLPTTLKQISSESYFSVEEESNIKDPYKLYLLYLPAFRGDSTKYGLQTWRQDIYYRKGDRDYSWRLRLFDSRNLNNRLLSGEQKILEDDISLRLWKSISPTTSLESTYSHRWHQRWLISIPQWDIIFNNFEGILNQRLSSRVELRVGLGFETGYDKVSEVRTFALNSSPQIDYSFIGKGKITLNGGWTEVVSNDEIIPYEMTSGKGAGSNFEWGVNAGYRIGKNLNLSANYSGESKVGRPVIHNGRMELRAFF